MYNHKIKTIILAGAFGTSGQKKTGFILIIVHSITAESCLSYDARNNYTLCRVFSYSWTCWLSSRIKFEWLSIKQILEEAFVSVFLCLCPCGQNYPFSIHLFLPQKEWLNEFPSYRIAVHLPTTNLTYITLIYDWIYYQVLLWWVSKPN